MRKRERGEGGVRLRGNVWWILYRRDGKQFSKSTRTASSDGTSKEVALAMLRDELTDTSRGAIPTAITDKLTFEEIRDAYLEQNPEQRNYYGLQYLDSFFKGMAVKNITSDTLRKFITHRRTKDKVKDPTIRRNLVALRAMLHQAREENKLQLHTVPYFPMPDDSEPAGQYIEPKGFAKILTHLPENLRPFFTFMYGTGCRLGALKKITWDMVNSDCTEIKLPAEIMKSRTPLIIVLAGTQLDPIAAMLRKMFRDSSKPVFDSANFRVEWSRACAKSGLGTWNQKTRTRTGVRIHDCRCSAAINLIDAGIDSDIVMKIGGWKTQAMLSRYNVVNKKRIREAMVKGGEYVAQKMHAKV